MTQEDFIFIIYESFDHLPALHSFFKKKRKDVKCIRSEYAFGLKMAFKTINEAVNQRDYNHVMFTKPDGETIEYELEEGHHTEQIFHLQTSENLKGAKTSFPNKIVLDLRRITNGRFNGILTAAHMEHLSPLLDAYLRTIEPVIEPVTENTEKVPQQNLRTKYESEFFSITDSLCYEFNEDLGLTFDTFNDELFTNIDKFKAEINENITILNHSDRGFYLKRILERLNKSIGITIHKNKKTGDEYTLKTDVSIDRVHTFEGNELEKYYRMSNIYKKQMIDFISQLNEPATETAILGFIENELNIVSADKITINKDGFPIDEKGNFVHTMDDQGNYIIRSVCHENIIVSTTDKQQNRKAAIQIAEYLSKNFSLNLENELLISVKTERVYTVEPARLPTVGIYFDSISKTLNYLGSVYGINFEYLIYINFKETTNNTFIAAKTGLYNSRALKKSVKFAKMWFIERDKIYLQKLELLKDNQSKPILSEVGTSPSKVKIIKQFPEHLLYAKPEDLANELRTQFSTEKGKGIRLMIKALQENEPKLLSVGKRQMNEIYTALKSFFGRDIGTYQSINDCNFDEIDLQPTKTKIAFILKSISKQE